MESVHIFNIFLVKYNFCMNILENKIIINNLLEGLKPQFFASMRYYMTNIKNLKILRFFIFSKKDCEGLFSQKHI